MIDLTDHLLTFDSTLDQGLKDGLNAEKATIKNAKAAWSKVRVAYGLGAAATELLTAPDANLKLAKATAPSYGLTLQHYVQKLSFGLVINACPKAGDCTKVCVLDNGFGLYPRVQTARRAKTEFLATEPYHFGVLLARELAKACDGRKILLRPNVNSDLQWECIAPSLTSGELFGDSIISYGYSKLPDTLVHNGGWVDTRYRVSYSWNEQSKDTTAAADFLRSGGNIAIVTDRKPGDEIKQWSWHKVVDADKTDEWILEHDGVWGDLSAKGRARKLIDTSGFVTSIYLR